MSILSETSHAFGLHIGDRSLKLVLLQSPISLWSKSLPVVRLAIERGIPPGIIQNGDIKDREKLKEELQQILLEARIKKTGHFGVVANLPEGKTFLKFENITGKNKSEIDERLNKIAASEIPFPKEELSLDMQLFPIGPNEFSALICAAPKSSVDAYSSILEEVGLTVFALEPEAVALVRPILPIPKIEEIKKTEMIIDLGGERTNVIFATGGIPRLSVLVPFSGNLITETIAKNLNLTLQKAEEIKLSCGLDVKKCEGKLRVVLNDLITNLVSRLHDAIKFYHSQFLDAPKVGAVHLSGGGAYLQKLSSIISKELRIKAREALNSKYIELNKKTETPLRFTAAIGLALRGLIDPIPNHE